MTDRQALAKAKKLWGKMGHIEHAARRVNKKTGVEYPERYTVGYIDEVLKFFPLFMVEGQGSSWEDAFSKVRSSEVAQ